MCSHILLWTLLIEMWSWLTLDQNSQRQ